MTTARPLARAVWAGRRLSGRRAAVIRSSAAGVAVMVAVAGLVLAGIGNGYPATRPRLSSGAAWLASDRVGQVTLLDGSSVEVAGQVPVATSGTPLDVVQQGSSAYVVDRSAGTVRRVDGATFEVGTPVTPVPGARSGLRVFAGAQAVYALDSDHGVLAESDPLTLARRGSLVPLSARIDAQGSVLDDAGRLWVVDAATGDLIRLDHGRREVRPGAGTPGAGLLAVAGGTPVLVDTARRTATVLDDGTGAAGRRTALDLRPGEQIQVSGAPHAPRLYVVTSRGVLEVCELAGAGCATAVPLDTRTGDLGTAVETGDRVFVPDYATGQVWVVDVHGWRVLAQPRVVDPQTHFQLFSRDGLVFFNDPDGTRAGVIRFDGGVRAIDKYAPAGSSPVATKPAPSRSPATTGGTPPPSGPTRRGPQPQPSPGRTGSPAAPGTPPASGTPSGPGTPSVRIVVSSARPIVGQPVTLQVVAQPPGTVPTGADWALGDGSNGSGLTVTHVWTAAGTYQVAVTATFPGGTTSVASVSLTVFDTHPPPPPTDGTLTLDVKGPGHVHVSGSGTNFDCSTTGCQASIPVGTRLTLTAGPDAAARLVSWSGACTGSAASCTFTMPAGSTTVGATFHQTAVLTVAVSTNDAASASYVSGPGIGRCGSTCQATTDVGDVVTLSAHKAGVKVVFNWGGACASSGSASTCTVTMNGDTQVSAAFDGTICIKPPFCVGGTSLTAGTAPEVPLAPIAVLSWLPGRVAGRRRGWRAAPRSRR